MSNGNWWMYHGDAQHSGAVEANTSTLTTHNVQLLGLFADITLAKPGSGSADPGIVESMPVIVDGNAYIGTATSDQGGTLYKIDLLAKEIKGAFTIPFKGGGMWGSGLGSSAAVVGGKVYICALDGIVYCLDANTLAGPVSPTPVWFTDLRNPHHEQNQYLDNSKPPAACWTSPLVVGVSVGASIETQVYVGVGQGDVTPGAFGVIYCLNAATGKVIWLFSTNQVDQGQDNKPNYLPPIMPPDQGTHPPLVLPAGFSWYDKNPGSYGASVWSSLAYDPGLQRVYCGTGNPWPTKPPPAALYSYGVISLDAVTGTLEGFFPLAATDSYRSTDDDLDMSGSPTVFGLPDGTRVVGIGGKNGSYFLLDAKTMQLLARRQLLPYGKGGQPLVTIYNGGGDSGIFSTAAVHVGLGRLFIGLGGDRLDCNSTPFVRALNYTGPAWRTLPDAWPITIGTDGVARYDIPISPLYTNPNQTGLSSPAVVNDLVFVTTCNPPTIYAFAADSGECLWSGPGLPSPGQPWSLGVAIYGNMVVAGCDKRLLVYQLDAGGWSNWGPLGGAAGGDPAVAQDAHGRLEVFVRGPNDALYHIRQTAPGDWSGSAWAPIAPVILVGDPIVAQNADGRLEVFFRDLDNAIDHIVQTAGGWSNWEPLGGVTNGVAVGDPAVAQNADGRLEVFVRGPDNALHHIQQAVPGNWSASAWMPMAPGILAGDPVVARNKSGRLEVFVRGPDNAIDHIVQTAVGWSNWGPLGGAAAGDPAVAQNTDGTLEVFVRGPDSALHHIRQTAPGDWFGSAWAPMAPGILVGNPVVARNKSGQLEVFVRDPNNAIDHIVQMAGGGWSNWWGPLGGTAAGDPAVAQNADSRLEMFVRGPDSALYHIWQTAPM